MRWAHILVAAAALAIATPASADLDLKRADVSHLPNGLTVILLEDHSFPLVSLQMLYKSGSAAEVTGKTSAAWRTSWSIWRSAAARASRTLARQS